MKSIDSKSPVWLTGFWGFSPEEEGILGFTDKRDRERLIGQIGERQLVCIYGAASPETDNKLVHHLLGVLEIERTPIDSWDKMSDTAKQRNIDLGRQEKWRFAMPVRRAWRTTRHLDVKQVFPQSYDPSNGRYIARFGTWLVPDEAQWLLQNVPFSQTNVFGEPPTTVDASSEQSIEKFLKPSAGVWGGFGNRNFQVQDKPHHLYLAQFKKSPELLAGAHLERGQGLVKIGISGDLKNRLKALNLSFPETTSINWGLIRTAEFPNRDSAGEKETLFKKLAIEKFGARSLGREFFIMDMDKAEKLFTELSPVSGLLLKVK